MNVRPLQDRILVRRVEEVEKTRGGIIIPDSAKERPLEGKVIAVGSGKRTEDGNLVKLDVKAGDRSCSASTPAPRSRWTAWSTSFCARTKSSA